MTRSEFIQQTVLELIKKEKFSYSELEISQSSIQDYCTLAEIIAKYVSEIAPFDDDIQANPVDMENMLMDMKEENNKQLILSTSLEYYYKIGRLSYRAYDRLYYAGIKTIRDVIKHPRMELLRTPQFGKKSLTDLDELLEDLGVQYAEYPKYE